MDKKMRQCFFFLFIWLAGMSPSYGAAHTLLKGGGSRVFEVLMDEWHREYKALSGVDVSYDPFGSGLGIINLQRGEVDFAMTDLPLNQEQLQKSSFVQLPVALTGITVVVNLKDIKQLSLSATVLADIYLGKIKKWNDPALKALNPTENLPNLDIMVMYRGDPAGSTKYFTTYLSKASRYWRQTVGAEVMVPWPVGEGIKNKTLYAERLERTLGAIGYLDYASAKKHALLMVSLENEQGNFITPTKDVFMKSLVCKIPEQGKIPEHYHKAEWPIIMVFYGLYDKKGSHLKEVFKFFRWAILEGDQIARNLGYVPPHTVVDKQNIELLK